MNHLLSDLETAESVRAGRLSRQIYLALTMLVVATLSTSCSTSRGGGRFEDGLKDYFTWALDSTPSSSASTYFALLKEPKSTQNDLSLITRSTVNEGNLTTVFDALFFTFLGPYSLKDWNSLVDLWNL